MENYDDDFMGKIALKILNMHMEKKICYQFDEEAEKVFESIINWFNEQFNLKYSGQYNISKFEFPIFHNSYITILCNILKGHYCMTHLYDTFMPHIYTTYLYDIFIQHIYTTHLYDTFIRHSIIVVAIYFIWGFNVKIVWK